MESTSITLSHVVESPRCSFSQNFSRTTLPVSIGSTWLVPGLFSGLNWHRRITAYMALFSVGASGSDSPTLRSRYEITCPFLDFFKAPYAVYEISPVTFIL